MVRLDLLHAFETEEDSIKAVYANLAALLHSQLPE